MTKEIYILERINKNTWKVYCDSNNTNIIFNNYKSALKKFLELKS